MSAFKRFPSFSQLQQGAVETVRRFPFALLAALVGTAMAMLLIENERTFWAQRLLLTCALGLPLFVALTSFAEIRAWLKVRSLATQSFALLVLVLYYFTLQLDPFHPHYTVTRWLLLAIGLHFLVAFLPFVGRGRREGFWAYNKTLFLRFLLAALYSAVLFAGLAIALAAADHLFGADVPEERYAQLWVAIAGVFNTWVFLAGVPKKRAELAFDSAYPKGLKAFTQFILLPLVGLYFLILIAYEIKIIIEWQWPTGWVSELILWYSVVGILSLLLLYPLRDKSDSTWIQVFSRWFFRAIVPLVVLLFLAILVRIGDYGFTPPRYFVFAMAVGLAVVVLYFIFSRQKDIRIIPIVLCLLALLSAYGPWSAFAISKSSQLQRLNIYLTSDVTANGDSATDSSASDRVGGNDLREMSSIVSYLVDWHGIDAFESVLDDATFAAVDTLASYQAKEAIAEALGFEYAIGYGSPHDQGYFSYSTNRYDPQVRQSALDIGNYDKLISLWGAPNRTTASSFILGDRLMTVSCVSNGDLLIRSNEGVLITIPIRTLLERHWPGLDQGQFASAQLSIDAENDSTAARLVVSDISGYHRGETIEIINLNADLLLRTP